MSHTSSPAQDSRKPSDRRRYARQRIKSLSYLDLGPGNGGIVLNISEGGLAVQAVGIFVDNPVLRISMQLPQSDEQLQASGQVTWTCESTREAGIQFLDLPEKTRAQIREWLSKQAPCAESRVEAGATQEKKKHVLEMRPSREPKLPIPEPARIDGMANDRFKAIFPTENASATSREFAPPVTNSSSTTSIPAATNVSPVRSESAIPRRLDIETPVTDSLAAIEQEIKATRDKLSGLLNPSRITKVVSSFTSTEPDITNEELLALFPSEKSDAISPQVNSVVATSRSDVVPIPTTSTVEPPRAHHATLSHPEAAVPIADPAPATRNFDDALTSPISSETVGPARPKAKVPAASFLLALPIPPAPDDSPLDFEDAAPPRFEVDSLTTNSMRGAESEVKPSAEPSPDMPATLGLTSPVQESRTSREVPKTELHSSPQSEIGGIRSKAAAPVAISPAVAPIISAPGISKSRLGKSASAQARVKSPLEGILSGTRIPRAAEKRPTEDSRISSSFWMNSRTLVRTASRPAAVFGLIFVVLLVVWMAFEQGAFDGLRGKMSSSTSSPVVDTTPRVPDEAVAVRTPEAQKMRQEADGSARQELPSGVSASVAPPEKPQRQAQSGQLTEPRGPKKFVWTLSPPVFANRSIEAGSPDKESPPLVQGQPDKGYGDALSFAAIGSRDSSAKLAPPPPSSHGPEQGDRLVACSLLYRVEPVYPPEAAQSGIEGNVKLRAVIGRNGRVIGLGLISGPSELVSAAMGAAREWRFLPGLLNGEPVESETDINIEFRLSHEAARQ
jgi:TonB family protein